MRKLMLAGLAALSTLVAGTAANAQTWPQRPITFMVPFAAGGGTDAFARPLAAELEKRLGQGVIIENRAGAGGTAGALVPPARRRMATTSSSARRTTPSRPRSIRASTTISRRTSSPWP